jgi:hypothetical protein
MNKRRLYVISLTVLLLSITLTTYGVWTQSSFSHGDPSNDQGCYCHNSGIGVWFNGTDSGLFPGVDVAGGMSFVLNVTSKNVAATGVVPGVQEWMSNVTDNGKFAFNPQNVSADSTQNLSHTKATTIIAFYKITAPQQGGNYLLTVFMQGANLQIAVQVSGPQTNSTTTASSSATGSSTSTTTVTQTVTITTTLPITTTATSTATQTVTAPGTTLSSTQTVTSTTTQTSSSVPTWAYATMAVLLIAGLAVGYIIKRPSVSGS